jgi:hypothetical protein
MRINLQAARQDLSLLVENIRELKRRRGESHQPHWIPADIRELGILKDNATLLCSLLAHRRKRLHLRDTTLEKQEKYVIPALRMYEVPEAQVA